VQHVVDSLYSIIIGHQQCDPTMKYFDLDRLVGQDQAQVVVFDRTTESYP